MIAMKNATSGATYMTAAKIARIVARNRRWLVADNAIAERDKIGPKTPSHNAESTSNQRVSLGSASVSHAKKNASENCQMRKAATTMMTMRRTPSVLIGHSLRVNEAPMRFSPYPKTVPDSGIRSLSANHQGPLSLMVPVVSSFLFSFCLVNRIEGVRKLVQKHQVRSTHTA
jgi:hypothetical protein